MKKWDRLSLAAVLAAACLLITAAFCPPVPRGAWWCTAFSVVCGETAEGSAQGGTVEYRCRLLDWWRALAG